ncbi:f-box domain containing protein [Colletotrichum musicola]|uniref:F-box domain containing protein n=1 Tax=Colletotrichum musicola TaxID=2175873 RepID=A0A8H6K7N4_9PEZI|nr:f-box domain containing protein [Colletotrichum musicola]
MLYCYAPPAHALYVADNEWAWPDSKSSGDPSHGPAHPATGSCNGLSLLDLDLDLIGLILDRLKILDLFLLSQTCRAMRALTQRDWALTVAKATEKERFEFWVDLVWMTPNRKHILRSPLMDRVRDVAPDKSSSFPSRAATSFYSRISGASSSMYFLHLANMQMAWALARMPKDRYFPELVEVVLQPRVREHRLGPVRRRETMSAKLLVEGLYVSVEVDYYKQQSPVSLEDFEEYFPDVCLHMSVNLEHESKKFDTLCGVDSGSRTAFTTDLRSALDNIDSEIQGACVRCRTDYSLTARQGRLTVRSWHEFSRWNYCGGNQYAGFAPSIFWRILARRMRFEKTDYASVIRSFWRKTFLKNSTQQSTQQSTQRVRPKFESTDVVVDTVALEKWSPRVCYWQPIQFPHMEYMTEYEGLNI